MSARVLSIAWLQERESAWRELRRQTRVFARSASSLAGLAVVAGFLVVAAVGPWIVPYPDDARGAVHLERKLQPPSAAHWFGTDEVGNDVYTRVVLGARVSLQIGLVITVIAAAHRRAARPPRRLRRAARRRELIMRVTDIFLSVPALVLALAVVGALGPGHRQRDDRAVARVVARLRPARRRARRCRCAREPYVEAARAIGAGRLRIVFVHLLPNCVSPIVVKASMDMGTAILAAASLGFIGLGAQPPYPEWGAMISYGRNYLPTWWWYSAFPGLAIYLTVLGFNLLGDGLRDLLDPMSRATS